MDWLDMPKGGKEEIVGIISAEYPEAGKRVEEILGYVVERLNGCISRSGLSDYVRLYIEFLDFGDLLMLRGELSGRWSVDSVNDVSTALEIIIHRAYNRAHAQWIGQ